MRMRIWLPFLLAMVARPCAAQTGEHSWENLNQLWVGEKIQVVDTNLKSLKGKFLGFSEEAISLRVGKDEVAIPRANVLRVGSRWKSKGLRRILIGMALGGGVGLVTGAALSPHLSRAIDLPPGKTDFSFMYATTAVGVLTGAALGRVFPGYQTVYRVKRKRGGTQP